MTVATKKPRGFAYLKLHNPEYLAKIAANGGHSVKPENRSFSTDKELATSAGRAGGKAKKQSQAA